MKGKIDTRNRWQRMNDARYEKTAYTQGELMTLKNRAKENNIQHFNRLSDEHGHTLKHPRTSELIRMKTSDVVSPKLIPRVYRKVAQPIQFIKVTRNKDGITGIIHTGKNRKKSWRSIWYSSQSRRK